MHDINPYKLNLNIIVATSADESLVIGYKGELPWNRRLTADMRWFRQVTMHHPVIMGRKTWDSIPEKFRPLSGRANIVVTRGSAAHYPESVAVATSYDHALREAATKMSHQDEPVFVIGGAQLYRLALPDARRIYATTVEDQFMRPEVLAALYSRGPVTIDIRSRMNVLKESHPELYGSVCTIGRLDGQDPVDLPPCPQISDLALFPKPAVRSFAESMSYWEGGLKFSVLDRSGSIHERGTHA